MSRYIEDEIDQVVKLVRLADEPDVGEWSEGEAYVIRAIVEEAWGRICDGVAMTYQNRSNLDNLDDAKRLIDHILQTSDESKED